MESRKIAKLLLDPRSLLLCLKPGIFYKIESSPLPEDTKYIYTYFDSNRGCFYVVIESESFEELPMGTEIPELGNIVFTNLNEENRLLTTFTDELFNLVEDDDLTDDKLREAAEDLLPSLACSLHKAGFGTEPKGSEV